MLLRGSSVPADGFVPTIRTNGALRWLGFAVLVLGRACRGLSDVYPGPLNTCSTSSPFIGQLPSLTMFVGSTETLLDDSVALARAAGLADVPVRLEIWPGMFHIWPTHHQVLAEAKTALGLAGDIIHAAFNAPG